MRAMRGMTLPAWLRAAQRLHLARLLRRLRYDTRQLPRAERATDDDGFRATVESWMDVDTLVGYFAVARLIDSWDDVVTFYCFEDTGRCVNHNYYWYEHTNADKIVLVPWDLDHTFEEPSPLRSAYGMPDWDEVDASCAWIELYAGVMGRAPACDPFLRRVVTELWPEYTASLQALLDDEFAPAAMSARIEALEDLLAPHVAADPTILPADWDWSIDNLESSVDAKRAYMSGKLAGPPP
jgi:hypothetical protein